MGKSNIEWTDETWNPIVGCSIVSPGCTNCYAMKLAGRRLKNTPKYKGLTQGSKSGPVWNGQVRLWEKALLDPLHWRKGRKIFVNSEGDLFHESIPDEWIAKTFYVMAQTPQHTYQVLTKRADRMREIISDPSFIEDIRSALRIIDNPDQPQFQWPLPNVWLGVSTERQQEADERIPLLLQTPAAVRFISAEPLLGPIDLNRLPRLPDDADRMMPGFPDIDRFMISALWGDRGLRMKDGKEWFAGPDDSAPCLDWVIVGGESGSNARPMHPDWPKSLRDQCAAAGVPFFFKQRGEYTWVDDTDYDASNIPELPHDWRERRDDKFVCMKADGSRSSGYGGDSSEFLYRVGKKSSGRLLDGKEHNDFPKSATPRSPVVTQPSNAEAVVNG